MTVRCKWLNVYCPFQPLLMEMENIDIAIDGYYNAFEMWSQPLFFVIMVQSSDIMFIYHLACIC